MAVSDFSPLTAATAIDPLAAGRTSSSIRPRDRRSGHVLLLVPLGRSRGDHLWLGQPQPPATAREERRRSPRRASPPSRTWPRTAGRWWPSGRGSAAAARSATSPGRRTGGSRSSGRAPSRPRTPPGPAGRPRPGLPAAARAVPGAPPWRRLVDRQRLLELVHLELVRCRDLCPPPSSSDIRSSQRASETSTSVTAAASLARPRPRLGLGRGTRVQLGGQRRRPLLDRSHARPRAARPVRAPPGIPGRAARVAAAAVGASPRASATIRRRAHGAASRYRPHRAAAPLLPAHAPRASQGGDLSSQRAASSASRRRSARRAACRSSAARARSRRSASSVSQPPRCLPARRLRPFQLQVAFGQVARGVGLGQLVRHRSRRAGCGPRGLRQLRLQDPRIAQRPRASCSAAAGLLPPRPRPADAPPAPPLRLQPLHRSPEPGRARHEPPAAPPRRRLRCARAATIGVISRRRRW